jgi:hypothetical protein
MPWSTTVLVFFATNLPYKLANFAGKWLSDHYSLMFSNLNASKKAFKFAGKAQLGQFLYVPNGLSLFIAVGVCTTGPYSSISCYANVERMKNPQELVDIFILKNKANIG